MLLTQMIMTTRITIPHDVSNADVAHNPTKTTRYASRKRKITNKKSVSNTKVVAKPTEKNISNLKVSLRDECLRLAVFLRQESHRPGLAR